MDIKLYNIVAIVNEGFSDLVMEIAKDEGARGGTIISANGSVTEEATKLYGIGIHPEKENRRRQKTSSTHRQARRGDCLLPRLLLTEPLFAHV